MEMTRFIFALGLLALTACGFVQPGTPGHEPPDGSINPITHSRGGAND